MGWNGINRGLGSNVDSGADLRQVSSLFCQPGPAALSRLLQAPTHTRAGVGQVPFPLLPLPFPSAEEGSTLNAKVRPSGPLLLPRLLRLSSPVLGQTLASGLPLMACFSRDYLFPLHTAGWTRVFKNSYLFAYLQRGGGMIEGKINYYFSSLTK